MVPTLAVLHTADLFRNPTMKYPTMRDWQKVQDYLKGEWPLPLPKYVQTESPSVTHEWFQHAHERASYIVIDTEYAIDNHFLFLVGIGYPECDTILQFNHQKAEWWTRQQFGEQLREIISKKNVVFQNAVADIPVLEKAYGWGHSDYRRIDDTMLSHAVLWSDWPHDLEFLASIYDRHPKMKHLPMSDPLYNVGDVAATISVWNGISSEFKSDPLSKGIYETQSLKCIPIILKARSIGLRVNTPRVEAARDEYQSKLEWAQLFSHAYAGYPINIGSDDQLKDFLYRDGFKPIINKYTKNPTVDSDAISIYRQEIGPAYDPEEEEKEGLSIEEAIKRVEEGAHPILEARIVYAAAQQAISHYINPCLGHERIYPEFKIHAQASGRWSTTNPPMAQLPSDLRDIVIPDEEERWIEWDWDQIETRILAELANDEPYREAFRNEWDVHTLNACDIFGLSYPTNRRNPHTSHEDIGWRDKYGWNGKDDIRRVFTKRFSYRLHYGGEARLAGDIPGAKQLGLKPYDLIAASERYLKAHPAIRQYWTSIVADGFGRKESRTFMGRRRRMLVDGKSAIKRLLYNHPMQGGVADIFNVTCIRVSENCPDAVFKYGMHDSQKWGVHQSQYSRTRERVVGLVGIPWKIAGKDVILPATFKD